MPVRLALSFHVVINTVTLERTLSPAPHNGRAMLAKRSLEPADDFSQDPRINGKETNARSPDAAKDALPKKL